MNDDLDHRVARSLQNWAEQEPVRGPAFSDVRRRVRHRRQRRMLAAATPAMLGAVWLATRSDPDGTSLRSASSLESTGTAQPLDTTQSAGSTVASTTAGANETIETETTITAVNSIDPAQSPTSTTPAPSTPDTVRTFDELARLEGLSVTYASGDATIDLGTVGANHLTYRQDKSSRCVFFNDEAGGSACELVATDETLPPSEPGLFGGGSSAAPNDLGLAYVWSWIAPVGVELSVADPSGAPACAMRSVSLQPVSDGFIWLCGTADKPDESWTVRATYLGVTYETRWR